MVSIGIPMLKSARQLHWVLGFLVSCKHMGHVGLSNKSVSALFTWESESNLPCCLRKFS